MLDLMKKGSFLINCSRGGLVNESDLYEVLKSGKLAGAAFDVFTDEPSKDNKLFELDNFIATSHVAGYTDGAINALSLSVVDNIVDFLVNNKKPINIVNEM